MLSTGGVHVRIGKKSAALVLGTVALVTVSTLPAQASLSQPAVVSANAADTTPHLVLDDTSFSVYDFAQVGNTVYAGGRFQQVQDWARTTTYSRQNFVAFESRTGEVSPLDLSFDGMVTSLAATDTALYVGGAFANVNGVTRRGIMKYDLVNNRIDPTFAPTGMRTVSDIVIANGVVIAAGNFTKKIMALDPVTGADTGRINITVAGVVWTGDETRVQYIAVSPNGTRLVATGNFATVNGQSRRQAFMLNLGATATLSTWHAPRFDVNCAASGARDVSAQGVDFSPDGSYFVVVSTGGPTGTNGICDAAARFETANVSSTVAPTWINWTGGDTLYSVAVTGSAVYVGGHQRWLDNPQGSDFAGPGAVSRPGIGAINPVTGKALPWNPTKSRFHGTMALFATPQGLWVGSDGIAFGREDHAGIGFAPLDPTPDNTRPDTVIGSGPSGPVTDRSATFTFSATEPASFQCSLDGAAYTPCTSPMTYANLAVTLAHLPGGRHRRRLQRRREPGGAELDRGHHVHQRGREPGVRGGHVRVEGRRDDQHGEPGRRRALGRLGRGDLELPGRWRLRARRLAELGELHAGRPLHRGHLGPFGHPRALVQAARARVRERRAAGDGHDVGRADLDVATGDGGLHAGRARVEPRRGGVHGQHSHRRVLPGRRRIHHPRAPRTGQPTAWR